MSGTFWERRILSASIDASTLASLSDEQRASAQGADGSHHEHEDEYCAIYAINALIGSAQHAAPPAVRCRSASAAHGTLSAMKLP